MMVTEIPTSFATTDGESFNDKAAAEKHQALLDALQAFRDAEARLNRELMENAKTADGYPFSFDPWHYYRIWEPWPGMPVLEEFSTLTLATEARSCEARVARGKEEVLLVYYAQRGNERVYQRLKIEISSLYRKKENAMRALALARREWLKGAIDEVEETERAAGIGESPRKED